MTNPDVLRAFGPITLDDAKAVHAAICDLTRRALLSLGVHEIEDCQHELRFWFRWLYPARQILNQEVERLEREIPAHELAAILGFTIQEKGSSDD